jgi:RNA polymerase sigma-70 factor, ECF subfamily
MQESDEVLIERARRGDVAAVEVLLERHQAQVYRFGVRLCRDPDDAEDVLQDTLLAAARGLREFRGGASLSTWLYTIARSFCIKHRRRSKFAPPEDVRGEPERQREREAAVDPRDSPEDSLAGREVERALEEAVRSLEPMYREVLVLRDMEGLTAPEVAEVLGISVVAVKSRLHRARVAVRERVAPLLSDSSPPSPAAGAVNTSGRRDELPRSAAPSPVAAACPDVLTLFSQHEEGEISASVCADLERHLEGCTRCRAACDSLRTTLRLCKRVDVAPVPPALQAKVRFALRELLGPIP